MKIIKIFLVLIALLGSLVSNAVRKENTIDEQLTALIKAKDGDINELKRLLSDNPDLINVKVKERIPSIVEEKRNWAHLAASYLQLEKLKILVEKKPALLAFSLDEDCSPLHLAHRQYLDAIDRANPKKRSAVFPQTEAVFFFLLKESISLMPAGKHHEFLEAVLKKALQCKLKGPISEVLAFSPSENVELLKRALEQYFSKAGRQEQKTTFGLIALLVEHDVAFPKTHAGGSYHFADLQLREAVEECDASKVAEALKHGADIKIVSQLKPDFFFTGRQEKHWGAQTNIGSQKSLIIKYFVNKGAQFPDRMSVDDGIYDGMLLLNAVNLGDAEALTALLEKNVSPDACALLDDAFYRLPTAIARAGYDAAPSDKKNSYFSIVTLLVQKGATLHESLLTHPFTDLYLDTLLQRITNHGELIAAFNVVAKEMDQQMAEEGLTDFYGEWKNKLVKKSCELLPIKGQMLPTEIIESELGAQICEQLLNEKKIWIHDTDGNNRTYLHLACMSQSPEPKLVELLLKNGADPGAQDSASKTAFERISEKAESSQGENRAKIEAIKRLLKEGPTPKSDDSLDKPQRATISPQLIQLIMTLNRENVDPKTIELFSEYWKMGLIIADNGKLCFAPGAI